jgi:hypothetical protein
MTLVITIMRVSLSAQPRKKKMLKRWIKQILTLTQLELTLKREDGSLKGDILPSLKQINPTIECLDRFISTVVRVQTF